MLSLVVALVLFHNVVASLCLTFSADEQKAAQTKGQAGHFNYRSHPLGWSFYIQPTESYTPNVTSLSLMCCVYLLAT